MNGLANNMLLVKSNVLVCRCSDADMGLYIYSWRSKHFPELFKKHRIKIWKKWIELTNDGCILFDPRSHTR